MSTIESKLLKKWNMGHIGHFYIVGPKPFEAPDDFLFNWSTTFLNHWYKDNLFQSENPDILIVSPENGTHYIWNKTNNDFTEFQRFFEQRKVSLPKKIVIIKMGEHLSPVIQNKLLKSLEEAHEMVIFLLANRENTLIPTLLSRGIRLRPPTSSPILTKPKKSLNETDLKIHLAKSSLSLELQNLFSQLFLNHQGENELLDYLASSPQDEENLLSLLLDLESDTLTDFTSKENFLKNLKSYQVKKNYNNPMKERVFQMLPNYTLSLLPN